MGKSESVLGGSLSFRPGNRHQPSLKFEHVSGGPFLGNRESPDLGLKLFVQFYTHHRVFTTQHPICTSQGCQTVVVRNGFPSGGIIKASGVPQYAGMI